MILIIFKYLTPRGFRGLTFYPFVILANKDDKFNEVFMNHERIHIKQQIELLILPFYLWYVIEYLYRLIQYKDRKQAYLNISFEREAYKNERDLNYLKKYTFWNFLKFL